MAVDGRFWEGLHRCLAARDAIDNEFLRGLRHGSAFMVALASGGREPLLTPIRVMVGEQGAHAPRSPERSVTLLSENLNRATFYAGPHRDSVRILVKPRSIRSPTGRGCGRTPPGKYQATWRRTLHRRSGCRAWFTGSRGRILPGRTPTGTRWQDSTAPPFCPARRFPAPVGPKLAGMPLKCDEMDEASDLRVVPVDSTDPEVRTNFRRFARLGSRFHSGEQAAASP